MSDYWNDLAAEDAVAGDDPFHRPAQVGGASETDEPVADGGSNDPTGTVTVWTDADLRIVRVRVHGAWRDTAPALEARVARAAQQATAALAFGPTGPDRFASPGRVPRRDLADLLAHPIDSDTVTRLAEETRRLRDASRALTRPVAEQPGRSEPQLVFGRSTNRKVSVSLNAQMRPTGVSIDQDWARGVPGQRLVASVEEAFARAYAAWQPPQVEPGERDRLAAELADLRRDTLAVVFGRPGVPSTSRQRHDQHEEQG